ncbi:MAG: RHS repeat-associated core domain-containing protein [Spirochaetes bacterium]|nr:RHS repeat-associated core domain-containing protein [Spirochaetota bacterium]
MSNTFTRLPDGRIATINVPLTNGSILTNEFTFSALLQRMKKVDSSGTNYYLYDGDNISYVYADAALTQVKQRFIHGPGIDAPIAVEINEKTYPAKRSTLAKQYVKRYYHLSDAQNNVTYLTDDKQNIVQKYTYTAFGTPSITGEDLNIYTYTGREYDRDAGLYYYRSRHYMPNLGRFDRSDDMRSGNNWYTYVNNNPMKYTDPYGYWIYKNGKWVAEKGDTLSGLAKKIYGDTSRWRDLGTGMTEAEARNMRVGHEVDASKIVKKEKDTSLDFSKFNPPDKDTGKTTTAGGEGGGGDSDIDYGPSQEELRQLEQDTKQFWDDENASSARGIAANNRLSAQRQSDAFSRTSYLSKSSQNNANMNMANAKRAIDAQNEKDKRDTQKNVEAQQNKPGMQRSSGAVPNAGNNPTSRDSFGKALRVAAELGCRAADAMLYPLAMMAGPLDAAQIKASIFNDPNKWTQMFLDRQPRGRQNFGGSITFTYRKRTLTLTKHEITITIGAIASETGVEKIKRKDGKTIGAINQTESLGIAASLLNRLSDSKGWTSGNIHNMENILKAPRQIEVITGNAHQTKDYRFFMGKRPGTKSEMDSFSYNINAAIDALNNLVNGIENDPTITAQHPEGARYWSATSHLTSTHIYELQRWAAKNLIDTTEYGTTTFMYNHDEAFTRSFEIFYDAIQENPLILDFLQWY